MSFLAVAGIAVGVAGIGVAVYGQQQQAAGQKQQADAQKEALGFQKETQALQNQQNQVNATRQQRQMIREGIVARGTAQAVSTNQGGQLGSGLEGALAQSSAQVAENVGAVGQNMAFGAASYSLKQQTTDAYGRAADGAALAASGAGIASIGAGMSSLGGGMIKNQGAIERVGTYFQSKLFA